MYSIDNDNGCVEIELSDDEFADYQAMVAKFDQWHLRLGEAYRAVIKR